MFTQKKEEYRRHRRAYDLSAFICAWPIVNWHCASARARRWHVIFIYEATWPLWRNTTPQNAARRDRADKNRQNATGLTIKKHWFGGREGAVLYCGEWTFFLKHKSALEYEFFARARTKGGFRCDIAVFIIGMVAYRVDAINNLVLVMWRNINILANKRDFWFGRPQKIVTISIVNMIMLENNKLIFVLVNTFLIKI